ncbi:auxin-responsive protein SAUR23-like [Malus sylvestris]|uniref:auxin-responsive protein SAUR23-like n=1 Tax=Malus domestica TaxID=3750 RepID=UPI0010AA9E28|nr:auxin-responsive protein SAUR23-like [Malus domestica]XP_050149475.1 auxin-responsive protein SAUR23-like [Malus sylvestris]
MAIRLPQILRQSSLLFANKAASSSPSSVGVPKGYMVVYVGENGKKRFVIPISFLNHPSFQELLNKAVEEFGYNYPMGGLTIPCTEDIFIDLTSRLNGL